MIISKYFLWFLVYSFLGWILETLGCIVEKHRWESRGFLYGCVLPIYGFGGVGITIIADLMSYFGLGQLSVIQIFTVSFIGSAVIEYLTSYVLEKLFHARWWDYTERPLNINGRICLPFLIRFGVGGVVITEFIAPFLREVTVKIPQTITEIISLGAMAILSCDITMTAVALTDFEKRVVTIDNSVNRYMDKLVDELNRKQLERENAREERKEIITQRILEIQQQLASEREKIQKDKLENSFRFMSGRNAVRRVKKLMPLNRHNSDSHENLRIKSFEQVKKSNKTDDNAEKNCK